MMVPLVRGLICLLLMCSQALAADGLITVPSAFPVKATIDRLETALRANGAAVFARVDHAGGAASVGMTLRPTELIIFGNPKAGTPLMAAQQTAAIDLPQKMLAYQDAAGQVWLAYNDPAWIARRHGIGSGSSGTPEAAKSVDAISAMLKTLASKAASAP